MSEQHQNIEPHNKMRRRSLAAAAAAITVPWIGGCASPSSAPASAARKTYVLVHGAYHGAWCWQSVAVQLRARGHTVYTPTLTGLGERSHLIAFRPTLDTFTQDVTQVLKFEDLKDVILVGHSFAGSVVSGVADQMPERIRHLVYLDALLLQSGQAPFDGLPNDVVERYRRQAQETSGGLSVPPPAPEYFGITNPEQAAWLRRYLTPHPFGTYLSKLTLARPVGNGLPATYIACSKPYFASTAKSREFVRSTNWAYKEIPTAHDAMLLMPEELTEMLAQIG